MPFTKAAADIVQLAKAYMALLPQPFITSAVRGDAGRSSIPPRTLLLPCCCLAALDVHPAGRVCCRRHRSLSSSASRRVLCVQDIRCLLEAAAMVHRKHMPVCARWYLDNRQHHDAFHLLSYYVTSDRDCREVEVLLDAARASRFCGKVDKALEFYGKVRPS
jgi:hypothetical protein